MIKNCHKNNDNKKRNKKLIKTKTTKKENIPEFHTMYNLSPTYKLCLLIVLNSIKCWQFLSQCIILHKLINYVTLLIVLNSIK